MKTLTVIAVLAGVLAMGLFSNTGKSNAELSAAANKNPDLMETKPEGYPHISLGGGCFWCMEWEFNALPGVLFTESGYQGGSFDDPSYHDVTTGKTGHAEVVQVTYDPEKVSLPEILAHFLRKAHDPTQLNRQGVDVGPQYRSVIFYANDEEKKAAEDAIAAAADAWDKPIVTTVEPYGHYYPAEDYHQDYYEKYEDETGSAHIRVKMKDAKKN